MIKATCVDPQYRTVFANGDHLGVADMPVAKGGAGRGFGPHDLLEASLATCMVITAWKHAEERGLLLTSARCEVQIDRSAPNSATLIYFLSIDGQLTPAQERELKDAVARCPVAQTLAGSISLRSSG